MSGATKRPSRRDLKIGVGFSHQESLEKPAEHLEVLPQEEKGVDGRLLGSKLVIYVEVQSLLSKGGYPCRESGITSFASWEHFTTCRHQILEPGKRCRFC